ncbi:MAG: hypothetical protein WCT14_09265 [Treponemataceae bacterium]
MEEVLTYNDHVGSVHYCAESEVFYGKVEGIDDLISFEGKSVDDLKASFEEAVEDYSELCRSAGKEVEKSIKAVLTCVYRRNCIGKQKEALCGWVFL